MDMGIAAGAVMLSIMGDFFIAGFFAAGFLAGAFLAGIFFMAGFLAAGFLAAGFFAVGIRPPQKILKFVRASQVSCDNIA